MGKRVFLANATMGRVVLGLCLMVMLMVGMVTNAHAEISIRYAKPDGAITGECLSWASACTLQRAIEVATNGEEIWVAKGVQLPGYIQ